MNIIEENIITKKDSESEKMFNHIRILSLYYLILQSIKTAYLLFRQTCLHKSLYQ
jgi:hypothetical protein